MQKNRYWRLDRNPSGNDFAAALSLQEADLLPLAQGEVRLRNLYLSMDAGTRMWMGPREDGYQPPQPFGAAMSGQAIGEVIESTDAEMPVGSLVRAFGQWAEYSTFRPDEAWAVTLDAKTPDIRQHFGVLGLNGWTALYGLQDIIGIAPGDVLVVSAAAGATGLLACQIGRLLGAQVIGIAGGPEKCAYLKDRIGVAMAIDYKNEDVAARIIAFGKEPTALFENVGGEILDAIMPNMALHGRIGICGLIAGYDLAGSMPGPRNFDQVLMKRLRIGGIFLPDVPEKGPQFERTLADWLKAGAIDLPFDMTQGIENTLVAYGRMISGKNIGKTLLKL
ncbi:NADP-dependent oxidoreductase [Croceicoccus sp. F390]|uniref:NADP-dependent oxidoreductase n=1 Tax=Croceicoccus esteveae TaxID=3075597 RepID=A0ABU2ZHA2_9SPHN|nr:NADP-dependent oxidoreductase [Croceicoccus sp. F390]MDT0575979.1 NADP-dependent oxidoreductase [Croceicoccus sp. F390]